MCVKLPFGDLNPDPCLSHPTNGNNVLNISASPFHSISRIDNFSFTYKVRGITLYYQVRDTFGFILNKHTRCQ